MTPLKTDDKAALIHVGQLHKLLSFEPEKVLAIVKSRCANTGLRNKSLLIAIGMAFGMSFVGDAEAAKNVVVDSPVNDRRPIEKHDPLINLTNPRHFPPDVDTPDRNRASNGLIIRRSHQALVPGTDFTKNPPEPLQMGSKDVDPVKTLQIVDTKGKLLPEYLTYLRRFKEKPFSEIKDLGQILRFVLIESRHKPILITVDFKTKSGITALTAKQLGKGFQLDKNETIELTPEQSESLMDKVKYPELWKQVPYTKTYGDYSYWILETWDGKKYQSATQFLPKDGFIKELGDELLSLANLRTTDTAKP